MKLDKITPGIPVIKCFGGPLHDQYVPNRKDRFEYKTSDIHGRSTVVSYFSTRYNQRCGNGYRSIDAYILEGSRLLVHEEYSLEHELQQVPWAPVIEPDFFDDFEDWLAWTKYRVTGNFKYILKQLDYLRG